MQKPVLRLSRDQCRDQAETAAECKVEPEAESVLHARPKQMKTVGPPPAGAGWLSPAFGSAEAG